MHCGPTRGFKNKIVAPQSEILTTKHLNIFHVSTDFPVLLSWIIFLATSLKRSYLLLYLDKYSLSIQPHLTKFSIHRFLYSTPFLSYIIFNLSSAQFLFSFPFFYWSIIFLKYIPFFLFAFLSLYIALFYVHPHWPTLFFILYSSLEAFL